MAANRQPLCLNMIVKNEAPVIARCLASLRPIIDYWVIVDTGSTDGTQDKIRTLMADLPGELHERPWRDFAHNRTEALELARPHGEYVLIIDADDVLEFEPQFKMPALQKDSYMLRTLTPPSPITERRSSGLPCHGDGGAYCMNS
jgi:glycosyltransferase involved in cell wall biosynthesis